MIKKLKIFAVAMLATGATVAVTNAQKTTNIVQPVSLTLQVYYPSAVAHVPSADSPETTVKTGTINSKDLIHSILQGAIPGAPTFSAHATLGLLTLSNEVVTVSSNAISTNETSHTNFVVVTNTSFGTTTSNAVLYSTNLLIGTLLNETNGANTNIIVVGAITNVTYGSTNIIGSGSFTNTNTVTFGGTNVTIVNYTSNSTAFTSNTITIYQPTNELASTNYAPSVLLASTNITETLATTNFTTNVTTVSTNGLETVTVTGSFVGDGATNGTTNTTYVLNVAIPANLLTVIDTNSVVIGSETTTLVPATNLLTEIGAYTNTFDTNVLVITTNLGTNASGTALSLTIGTSVVSFVTTNTTTNIVLTNGVAVFTTSSPTNFSVAISGIVVDTNGVVSGGSATSTNSDAPAATSLSTEITTVYSTNFITATNGIATNVISVSNVVLVVAPITVTNGASNSVIATNIASISNTFVTNYSAPATNSVEVSEFVVVDGSGATLANTPVPTNVLNITSVTTGAANIIGETIASNGSTNAETEYSVKELTISATNTGLYFTLYGLDHSTLDNFKVVAATHAEPTALYVPVTNQTLTIVGYGLTNETGSSNVVIGGTITIGTPAKEVITP